MENKIETQIIVACQSGNWENFGQIYDLYLPKIYQYFFYRLRHKQTAEDLTATVFMKMVRGIRGYHPNENSTLQSWLYGIARNALIDHLRADKPTAELDEALGIRSSEDLLSSTDINLKIQTIKSALVGLTPVQREVVSLRVWDGLSHREIAEIVNINESNSKITFSRAISHLKQQIPLTTLVAIIISQTL